VTHVSDIKDEVIAAAMKAQAEALAVVDAVLDGASDVDTIMAATKLVVACQELNALLKPVAITNILDGSFRPGRLG